MPPRFYKKYELSDIDLQEWSQLVLKEPENYHYLILDLMEIINTDVPIKSIEVVPLSTPGNKTMQYYASKVLRYIRQLYLTKTWEDYLNLPAKQQTLEKAAVIVAQWCQPNQEVSYQEIGNLLDSIADLVRVKLAETNPNHPLLHTPNSVLNCWRGENLNKNQWNITECRQIIVAMREVMYSDLGFSGNNIAYYSPENSLINAVSVFETSNVNYSSSFLLCWPKLPTIKSIYVNF